MSKLPIVLPPEIWDDIFSRAIRRPEALHLLGGLDIPYTSPFDRITIQHAGATQTRNSKLILTRYIQTSIAPIRLVCRTWASMATKYLVEHIIISSLSQLEQVHHSLLNVPRISMCAIYVKSVYIDEMITMTSLANWELVGAILERTPRVKFLQVHPHPTLVPTLVHHAGLAIRRLQLCVSMCASRMDHPLTGTDAFNLISACADKLQVLILNLDYEPFVGNSEDMHERQLFLPELHTLSVADARQHDLVLIAPMWRLPKLAYLDGAERLSRSGACHLFSCSNMDNASLSTCSLQALTLISQSRSRWLPAFDRSRVEDVVLDRRYVNQYGSRRVDYSEYRTCQRLALRYGVDVYQAPDSLVHDIDFGHCEDVLCTFENIFPRSNTADKTVCALEGLKVIRILMTAHREAPEMESEISNDAVAYFTRFADRVFWVYWGLKLRAASIVLEAAWDNGHVVELHSDETAWGEEVAEEYYEKYWGSWDIIEGPLASIEYSDDEDNEDDEDDEDTDAKDMRVLDNWFYEPSRR